MSIFRKYDQTQTMIERARVVSTICGTWLPNRSTCVEQFADPVIIYAAAFARSSNSHTEYWPTADPAAVQPTFRTLYNNIEHTNNIVLSTCTLAMQDSHNSSKSTRAKRYFTRDRLVTLMTNSKSDWMGLWYHCMTIGWVYLCPVGSIRLIYKIQKFWQSPPAWRWPSQSTL